MGSYSPGRNYEPLRGTLQSGLILAGIGVNANALATNDLAYFTPYYLHAGRISGLLVNTSVAGGAGAIWRVGLAHSPNPQLGPTELLLDAGTVDATVVEIDEIPVSFTWHGRNPFLWTVVVAQGGGAPAPTFRGETVTPISPYMVSSNTGVINVRAWTQGGISGALPSTFVPNLSNTSLPRVGIRGA